MVQVIRSCTERFEENEIRSALGPDAALVAQIVPELFELIDQPRAVARFSEPDEAQFRLYDAVLRLFLALSKIRPMVVILDDLHWADIASLKLLEHVAQGLTQSRAFLLGTYRDVELS